MLVAYAVAANMAEVEAGHSAFAAAAIAPNTGLHNSRHQWQQQQQQQRRHVPHLLHVFANCLHHLCI
jgi:hypothetical protein